MLSNGYLDKRLKMKKKTNKTKVTNGSKKIKSFSSKGKYYVTSTTTLALRRKMDYKKWIIICSKFFWRYKFNRSVWKYFPRRWEYY